MTQVTSSICAAKASTTLVTSKRLFQLETSRFLLKDQPGKLSAYVIRYEYMLVRQWFSKFILLMNPLGFVKKKKYQVLGYTLWISDSPVLGWGQGTCTFTSQARWFWYRCSRTFLWKTLQLSPTNAEILTTWMPEFPYSSFICEHTKIECCSSNHTKDPLWTTVFILLWLIYLMLNWSWNWFSLIFVEVRKIQLNHIPIMNESILNKNKMLFPFNKGKWLVEY